MFVFGSFSSSTPPWIRKPNMMPPPPLASECLVLPLNFVADYNNLPAPSTKATVAFFTTTGMVGLVAAVAAAAAAGAAAAGAAAAAVANFAAA